MGGRNAVNTTELQDSILKRKTKSQHHNNKENIITQKAKIRARGSNCNTIWNSKYPAQPTNKLKGSPSTAV
ncbi:hypothetical protein ACET3Z_014166 [Daucus carota]